MTFKELYRLPQDLYDRGVAVISTPDLRWKRCDIKTISLLPNILAKQEAAQAKTDYVKSVEAYRAKKKETDTIRSKLSKAQQETNLSNTNLARLKPAYDTIIRP